MKDYIKEKLLSYSSNEYMKKYIEICEFYQEKPCKTNKYNFHHIFPAFLYKQEHNAKNRNKIIDDLDKEYIPKDNIVKLPNKWHFIVHYFLGKALLTKEAINSFQIFIGDFNKNINDYTLEEVKLLGQEYEDTTQLNTLNEYMTNKEKQKYYYQQYKEYMKSKKK